MTAIHARATSLRALTSLALLLTLCAVPVVPSAQAAEACDEPTRILVLGAMPLELYPLLQQATVDPADVVRTGGRTFYVGQLGGAEVVLAMTRVGMVNARQTAELAVETFCGLEGAVFSGVAGSRANIGDVMIPETWTADRGATWMRVDGTYMGYARALEGTDHVTLARDVPVGEDACVCPGVEAVDTPVHLEHEPQVLVGGQGTSFDSNGDHPMPCIPGGGDVEGCEPCLPPGSSAEDAVSFATNAPSFLDPDFIFGNFQEPTETPDDIDAQDMESAAVAAVMHGNGLKFIGVRAVSDGKGDPLGLPGFPVQFFVYRQLAGNNAAATTIAWLERWAAGASTTVDEAAPLPGPVDGPLTGPSLPATGATTGVTLAGSVLLGLAFLLVRRRHASVLG